MSKIGQFESARGGCLGQLQSAWLSMFLGIGATLAFACGAIAQDDAATAGIPGVEAAPVGPVSLADIEASAAKFANVKPIHHERGYAGDLSAARLLRPAPGPEPDHVVLTPPAEDASDDISVSATPPLGTRFDGIPDTGSIPADPIMAVGGSRIIQVVNRSIRITDRLGGGALTSTLVAMMGNPSGGSGSLFDPRVQYDHFNSRFVVLALVTNTARTDSWYLVSVSKNSTPTTAPSSWFTYHFRSDIDFPSTNTAFWGDYAPLAFDNAYFYITSNQFNASGTFQYSKIRRYPKSSMYAGGSVSGVEWNDVRNTANGRVFTIQPAVTFGVPGSEWLAAAPFGTGNTLAVFRITGNTLFRYSVAVGSTSLPSQARQRNTSALIDSGDNRLLNAVFSNNRLYVAHTVRTSTINCAARILGINTATSTPTRVLDRVIGSTTFDMYYPAVACNPATFTTSRLAIVANFSSPTRFAGITYTQMTPTGTVEPLGLLREGQNTYFKTYSGTRNRWGDYNGICRDPLNSNRFWFNAMYARSTINTWGTYVGSTLLNTTSSLGVNATFDSDNSQLVIGGNDFANRVQVTRDSEGVHVKGLAGTLVNGRSSVTFSTPEVISLNVNLGGGPDELSLIGLHVDSLEADLGPGNDRMVVSLCTIDQLRANGGSGTDVVTTTSSTVTESTLESVP